VNTTRRTSIATGALLILATIAVLAADALKPALTGTDYLTGVANHPNQLAVAALLYLIAAGGSVGIAIVLYPLLKQINAALALGSVVCRTIEAVFYTAAVVSLLSILPLGQQFATTPTIDRAPIQAIADALVSIRENSTLVAVFAFTLGALMYYTLFYRSLLVPRWLSGWGLVGAVLILVATVHVGFTQEFGFSTVTNVLSAPIGLQEMVLAVWLIAKGFNPSAVRSIAPSTVRSTTP